MDDKLIKEFLHRAEEITKGMDPDLRPAAFKAAFDLLVGQAAPPAQPHSVARAHPTPKAAESVATNGLMDVIDRTKHPEVIQERRVLEKSLHLLRAGRSYGHEYLSAGEIAKILVKKFHIRTTPQAVKQALDKDVTLTDTEQRGGVTYYAIMQSGEDHLAKPESEREKKQFKRSNGRRARKKTKEKLSTEGKPRSKRSNGSGPKGIMMQLIQEGFFASPKTIGELRDHIKHKKGHTYETAELSTPLVRLVRDGVLDRTTNPENQYVYATSKS